MMLKTLSYILHLTDLGPALILPSLFIPSNLRSVQILSNILSAQADGAILPALFIQMTLKVKVNPLRNDATSKAPSKIITTWRSK